MRQFKFKKPLVESPYPPKSKHVLWVDVNESTGKISTIKLLDKYGLWQTILHAEGIIPIEPPVRPLKPDTPAPYLKLVPDNEIWYKTINGELATLDLVNLGMTEVGMFGANIIEHTYNTEEDKGIITFDGPVTSIGLVFNCKNQVTHLWLPGTIKVVGLLNATGSMSLIYLYLEEGVQELQTIWSTMSGMQNTYCRIPSTIERIEGGPIKAMEYNGSSIEMNKIAWGATNPNVKLPTVIFCKDGCFDLSYEYTYSEEDTPVTFAKQLDLNTAINSNQILYKTDNNLTAPVRSSGTVNVISNVINSEGIGEITFDGIPYPYVEDIWYFTNETNLFRQVLLPPILNSVDVEYDSSIFIKNTVYKGPITSLHLGYQCPTVLQFSNSPLVINTEYTLPSIVIIKDTASPAELNRELYNDTLVFVPEEVIGEYKEATNWCNANILPLPDYFNK